MNFLKRFRNSLIVLCVLSLGWAAYFTWFDGSAKGSSTSSVVVKAAPQEMNLVGHWTGDGFYADVTDDSIQIKYKNGSIYWMGTFDAGAGPWGSIMSLPDQDAMSQAIFASTAPNKSFTYGNGELSFDFSIAGANGTAHMTRS